jgi:hypothetical protein
LSDTTIEAVSPEHPWVPYDPFWPFHSDMKRPSFDCSSTDDLSTMSREALEAFVAKAVPSIAQTLQTAKLQPPLKN